MAITLTTNAQLEEVGADPGATANTGKLYTKDVTAITELFYQASDGTVTQLTPGGAGAPTGAQYLTLALNASLTAERVFTTSTGLTAVDGGANGNYTVTADLSTGKAGGLTATGGTAASETLTLSSTTHATKGKILVGTSAYDEATNRLGIGTASPTASLHTVQPVATSGSPTAVLVTGGAHTTLAAGTEARDVSINLTRTVQFATGAITQQNAVVISPPTYAFVAASTITSASTFTVTGAPSAGTNATLTNSYALWIQAGRSQFDGPTSVDTITTNGFRLTTETAVPVSTTDRTSQSTIYLTPFSSGEIWTYDSSVWTRHLSAEVSLALTGLTSGKNYDVFAYWTGSALALELSAAWTTDTARADAIARQDGVWVKSGTASRRYVATIRTTSTTATEDSDAKRYVWNAHNRVKKGSRQRDTTSSWTETSTTFTSLNSGNANWKHEFVIGLSEDKVECTAITVCDGVNAKRIAIGLDSTTADSSDAVQGYNGGADTEAVYAMYTGYPGIGYHFLQGLFKVSSGTANVYGTIATGNQQSQFQTDAMR